MDDWDDDPDDAPELCEHCEYHPAMHQTSEGWLCGGCDRRLNPRGGDDD